MLRVTRDEYDERRADQEEENGEPRYYTVIGKDLWVVPAADAVTMQLIGRYIRRVETPTTASADGFTSAWFTPGEGLELVVEQAAAAVRAGYYKDLPGAQGFENTANEVLASAVLVSNSRRRSSLVRSYFVGDWSD